MPESPPETFSDFLARQDKSTLVNLLVELADADKAVLSRLQRMQLADKPDKLAAAFKKALSAWRRSRKFHSYSEADDYAQALHAWLDQVANELMPRHPPAALELFELFIESDSHWFEQADDSGGSIGGVVRAACVHWLEAAALCETPRSAWQERIVRLFDADAYGAREELFRQAERLLTPQELRQLVDHYQKQISDLVPSTQVTAAKHQLDSRVFRVSAALSLLSDALRDPDIRVRAVLTYSPSPNGLQKEAFAEAYLAADRPADALRWLEEPWDSWNTSRKSLLADTLLKLGRTREGAVLRQEDFEATRASSALDRWLQCLPIPEQTRALARARELALADTDAARAAKLLLHLNDAETAEQRIVLGAGQLDGKDYSTLTPLAQALEAHGCHRAEAAVYRALMHGILDRAYSPAYSHAARYLHRLRALATAGVDMGTLPSHDAFEAELRLKHGRKPAFWAAVNKKPAARGSQSDSVGDGENPERP
jgi:hypothetical protein